MSFCSRGRRRHGHCPATSRSRSISEPFIAFSTSTEYRLLLPLIGEKRSDSKIQKWGISSWAKNWSDSNTNLSIRISLIRCPQKRKRKYRTHTRCTRQILFQRPTARESSTLRLCTEQMTSNWVQKLVCRSITSSEKTGNLQLMRGRLPGCSLKNPTVR